MHNGEISRRCGQSYQLSNGNVPILDRSGSLCGVTDWSFGSSRYARSPFGYYLSNRLDRQAGYQNLAPWPKSDRNLPIIISCFMALSIQRSFIRTAQSHCRLEESPLRANFNLAIWTISAQ